MKTARSGPGTRPREARYRKSCTAWSACDKSKHLCHSLRHTLILGPEGQIHYPVENVLGCREFSRGVPSRRKVRRKRRIKVGRLDIGSQESPSGVVTLRAGGEQHAVLPKRRAERHAGM